jgi:hypothetical protein
MKQPNLFSMLLFTFFLILLAPNLTKAMLTSESTEIPYQVNTSDHIILGTVSGINEYNDHTIVTITVDEWLYKPIPEKTIKVRTEFGINIKTEDQPVFTQNESVLLMLKNNDTMFSDKDVDKNLFSVAVGDPGKHPISDRDTVIKELKAQGKWEKENQTVNKTNNTETISKIEIISSQKENITENMTVANGKAENIVTSETKVGESNTTQRSNTAQSSNRVPFISSIWIFAILFMAAVCIKKSN